MPDHYRNSGNCRQGMRRSLRSVPSADGSMGDLPMENRSAKGACSAGCRSGESSCRASIRQLQMLDFSLTDTVLYLDAYPTSQEALAHYHSLLSRRDALRQTLAAECHMPMTALENASTDSWHWINGPWPWELCANE